jgi:hypothetical protein
MFSTKYGLFFRPFSAPILCCQHFPSSFQQNRGVGVLASRWPEKLPGKPDTTPLAGQSEAAFFPGANGAVTELRQGTMVVALNTASESFEVFVSDVRIIPKNERPVLAEVTMKAPCDFQIKVLHGHLEATAVKETETLDQGHTYDVTPEFYINDTRNPAISPDAPEYHRGHQHTTCGLAARSGGQPHFPRKKRFAEVVVTAAVGVGTVLVLREALESPDRP